MVKIIITLNILANLFLVFKKQNNLNINICKECKINNLYNSSSNDNPISRDLSL